MAIKGVIAKIWNGLAWVAVIVALVGGLGSCVYLDYSAYRERFPHAAKWSYFFGRGHR